MATVIYWVKKCMRIHDNPSLFESIKESKRNNYKVKIIYLLDTHLVEKYNNSKNRWNFIFESLIDLNKSLHKLGLHLEVVEQKYTIFEQILKNNVKSLYFEKEIDEYSLKRDNYVKDIAKKYNVKVTVEHLNTIYNHDKIKFRTNISFKTFVSVLETETKYEIHSEDHSTIKFENTEENQNNYLKTQEFLEEKIRNLKIDSPCDKFIGGETTAVNKMNEILSNQKFLYNFSKPESEFNLKDKISTAGLSPYITLGCLSVRVLYDKIYKLKSRHGSPVDFKAQVLRREFFYFYGANVENFDKIKGNGICKQIKWEHDEVKFNAWRNGQTGYPIVDAVMRQLKNEGWIHHLARHLVACFLTRGDLWISWEKGAEVFEDYLLDHDWILNAANWMWLSCSSFFYQYHRVYSPNSYGKKNDMNGKYIKKYVPELSLVPPAYIYEPWKMNKMEQKKFKCVLGQDYPNRIVIHEKAHKENISKIKKFM